jgi:MFS superfamily sulfate permease-like transporter
MLVVILFFSSTLRSLPQPVLAAIVLVAVAGLFKPSELRHLWKADRPEFIVAGSAAGRARFWPLTRRNVDRRSDCHGATVAARLSAHVATLGRIPGTNRFSDVERNPDNESVPGIMIFPGRVKPALLQRGIRPRYGAGSSAS